MRFSSITISILCLVALALSGCTRAGGAASATDEAALRAGAAACADELENARSRGDFRAFAAEADAIEAERLAGPFENEISSAAIRLWATARLRQGLPLETAQLARIALDDPALQTVLAWSDLLADAAPFQVEAAVGETAGVPISESTPDSLIAELLAVDGSAKGNPCKAIFIDTGAQHTVMTRAAAEAAGVRVQPGEIELAGFASATAQAGLIETLQLGPLTIRNVPVLVGDSPALTAAEGSMSLGTDLLYHLRVTLDYPERRVTIEPASASVTTTGEPASAEWRIPVWTFSRLPLAQGLSADGTPLRVLIDTGDRRGTYISYRWGRREIPQLAGVHSGMVFRYKKKDLTLPAVELGGRVIADWPVVDTLPKELDRLDVVDLMLGHDLLKRFRVTVDLARGEFRLTATDPQAMQSPIRPAAVKGEYDLP